jgi:hypothetical protein
VCRDGCPAKYALSRTLFNLAYFKYFPRGAAPPPLLNSSTPSHNVWINQCRKKKKRKTHHVHVKGYSLRSEYTKGAAFCRRVCTSYVFVGYAYRLHPAPWDMRPLHTRSSTTMVSLACSLTFESKTVDPGLGTKMVPVPVPKPSTTSSIAGPICNDIFAPMAQRGSKIHPR